MKPLASALRSAADDNDHGSLSHRLRARRFARFEREVESMAPPLRILDIGGTVDFWEQRRWTERDGIEITLVNLQPEASPYANLICVVADATDLSQFESRSFDLVFSNSVIEHMGSAERQAAMAREVRRVADAYWVQTPNYWFPMEPHYLVPGWQWLPERARVEVLKRRSVGQLGRCPEPEDARRVVQGTRLLRRSQLRTLFPEARIEAERFGGLVKSWTAIAGLSSN